MFFFDDQFEVASNGREAPKGCVTNLKNQWANQ